MEDYEDNFEYEDFGYEDNDQERKAEFNVFERVVARDQNQIGFDNAVPFKNLSPEEKFRVNLSIIYRNITEDYILSIGKDEQNILYSFSMIDKKIAYRNPTAYILGFFVNDNGTTFNINKFNLVAEKIDKKLFEDKSVFKEDVLRYSRYFTRNFKKY